jgi:NADH dehydrogenase [ubiquinone] 1 alpha subcomplex assembly factor 1
MKLLITIAMALLVQSLLIYDFNHNSQPNDWIVIDDVVMGGRSIGQFKINHEGHGVFSGKVSLENNGGFSSLRYRFEQIKTHENSQIVIRLKGDGKPYQFRVKNNRNTYYSYTTTFKTTGDWENITINLKDMYPSFRGRTLNMPHFNENSIEEMVFLIGNKKNESFELVLDRIDITHSMTP